ncbi:hypothetical protein LXL04_009779 [Taraxacum kok-saghyz]
MHLCRLTPPTCLLRFLPPFLSHSAHDKYKLCISWNRVNSRHEKFIPFTPAQLKDAEELGETVYNTVVKSIQSTTVVAYVRSYETSFD